MIRKLVMGLVLAALAGAGIQAQEAQTQQTQDQSSSSQQTPAQPPAATQAPAGQQSSSSQEASEEEIGIRRKAKPHNYKNWSYNVDAGANLARGTTYNFVRGGGFLAGGGVARNVNEYLGFRLDVQFVNLPLRTSALEAAQTTSASSHVYAFTLDPIISIPVTKQYTGYLIIGPGFYHRSGKLNDSTALPGAGCNKFFQWWGPCYNNSLPDNGDFVKESQNELGYNFGGGVAKRVSKKYEAFAEYRQQHGTHDGRTTDWRSIDLGVRW